MLGWNYRSSGNSKKVTTMAAAVTMIPAYIGKATAENAIVAVLAGTLAVL